MNSEYIERWKIFPNGVFFANANDPLASLDELINRIWSIPAADVAPVVHGRWVKDGRWPWHICSECERQAPRNGYGHERLGAFCDSCGARMDGE